MGGSGIDKCFNDNECRDSKSYEKRVWIGKSSSVESDKFCNTVKVNAIPSP